MELNVGRGGEELGDGLGLVRKSAIQALDRLDPVLFLSPGLPTATVLSISGMGTLSLYAFPGGIQRTGLGQNHPAPHQCGLSTQNTPGDLR